ncbi:MAG: hypothetical protein A2086_06200 [Spirochaetes bacterium GWD1_27_9]|nr:MAG: hypothetical protein A2Z98_16855 [Spirochaetes bacterium GWB1_27_13]OHD27855.1 MAG: hypothetical protein A2Y34_15595 [Spirochaetes bacterium GWC1_27_15]OHD30883.1 MAG: hypothetical protein A2086_06200 [Spirochaetes bacterium GWD1_27_9]
MFCIFIVLNCLSQNTSDIDAIQKTALDYIEGWYDGDVVRMERALHPNLIKRMITNPNSEYSLLNELNKEKMINYTNAGGGKRIPKNSYKIEVKILDINNNIASVMTKSQYIDYLHLAKFNNKWVIINVLWDINKNKE